jgi:CRP/FNR family transcriptional regulator
MMSSPQPGTPDQSGPGLFAALAPAELAAMQPYLSERQLPAGAELWQVGDAGDYLAWLVSGSIELKVDTEFPGRQLVMGVFRAGAAIGASCLLDHLPRSTAAKALEPTSLLLLDRARFAALTCEHPQIAIKLLKSLLLAESSRLRQAYARLASVF